MENLSRVLDGCEDSPACDGERRKSLLRIKIAETLLLGFVRRLASKVPEHARVPALTPLSAESLGIRALRSLRLGTSIGLMGTMTPRVDLN